MKSKRTSRSAERILGLVVPLAVFASAWAEHSGLFDKWRDLDLVEQVSYKFNHSYTPDASMPVYPEYPSWKPTLDLIRKYSKAKLQDRAPLTIARFRATQSTEEPGGSEWTAPSTPIVVEYRHWPGQDVPPADLTIVGTIGELQGWIDKSKSDFHFLIDDVLLGILAVALAVMPWLRAE